MALSIAALCATTIALSAAPAQAAFKRPLSATLTTAAPALNFALGVAVDNDATSPAKGEIYVADDGNHRIAKFNENGAFDGQIDSNNITGPHCAQDPGISEPLFVATDPTNGRLYVVDIGSRALTAFSPTGECLFQTNTSNGIPAGPVILGVAVDPNAGPHGTVYVSNRAPSPAIDEFDAETGAFTGSFPVTQNNALVGLAVDPAGHVYLADHNEPPNGLIKEYEPTTGALIRNFDTNTAQSVAVDPGNGHIFVGEHGETPQYQIVEFNSDTDTSPQATFGGGDFPSGGGGYGLAVNSLTNMIYASDLNANSIHVYGPRVIVPDVLTGEGLGVNHKITELTGHVDPAGGGPIEACQFEYVEAAAYNPGAPNPYGAGPPPVPCETETPINAAEEVTTEIEGLKGETTYHFRLVASNANGANEGADRTFVSAPAVLNVKLVPPATELDRTSATLHGSLNPDGIETHYHFEYGTGVCYLGGCASLPDLGPLADEPGTAGDPVNQHVTGLKIDTTYSYRLVAHNELGVSSSTEGTFSTLKAVFGLSTDPATEVKLTSATLNGALDPDGFSTQYFFKYGIDESYGQKTAVEEAGSTSTAPNPAAPVKGLEVTGLQPRHIYHYRIVATNSFGTTEGADQTFETPSTPTIDGFNSSNVTATSAELHAQINPQGFATTYHFEYGLTPEYGSSAPLEEEDIGSGVSAAVVHVVIGNLNSHVYHFRVVATNKWGTTTSEDQTFNFYPEECPNEQLRQETHSNFLPDCRGYELVSPSKQGSFIVFPGSAPAASYATNPARFAYGGGLGSLPGTNPPTNFSIDNYVATRTNSGWVTKYAGLTGDKTLGVGNMVGDLGFDTIIDFNQPNGGFGSAGNQHEQTAPYVWTFNGEPLGRWPANVEATQHLVEADQYSHGAWQTSPDFSHVAFSSNNYEWETGGLTTAPGSAYDYDTATGKTEISSILPGGGNIPQEPGQTNPSEWIDFPGDAVLGSEGARPAQVNPGVSTDGSHILMSTADPSGGVHLYMRVNDAVTYDISQGKNVTYVGMTADGTKVFFLSHEHFSGDTDNSTDLYMWSVTGSGVDSITRVSAGNNGSGNSDACSPAAGWTSFCNAVPVLPAARAHGDTSIASENGDIYFYSPEQLDGSKGIPNQENLYVYRSGEAQFVQTFAPGTNCEPVEEGACGNGPIGRMNVSPNDGHIAFITNQRLTGYDNQNNDEMYTYEPSSQKLRCVSCSPSGAPPVGGVTGADDGLFMSNDGRAFFYTPDALEPQDSNKLHDVYEYVGGRPQLITTGTSAADTQNTGNQVRLTGLAGVSVDGVNVFFSTFSTLVGQDEIGPFVKYYDARTGGGFPFHASGAPCEAADECHGAGSPPPPAPQIGSVGEVGAGGNWPTKKVKRHHKKSRRHRRGHAGHGQR